MGTFLQSSFKESRVAFFAGDMMSSQRIFELLSSLFFAIALLHTFLAGYLSHFANRFREGSFLENFFHLFGEVEIVFGFWSAILIVSSIALIDFHFTNNYLNNCNFKEAFFVFVIMAICSSRPILVFFESLILYLGELVPLTRNIAIYFIILVFTPLLGSFITEPASITISAFLLLPRFYLSGHSEKFKYATLALLFLNTSIGGTLTHFAAPPVLMVASRWNWNTLFMLKNFAIPTTVSVVLNTLIVIGIFKKEILKFDLSKKNNEKSSRNIPYVITFFHFIFLLLIILTSHYPVLFLGIFLFYLGFLKATKEYQSVLTLRGPLLVGFFLAGIIILGGPQKWWIEPLLLGISKLKLYLSAIFLTGFTDNAALTYLGSLVSGLDYEMKLLLVKGSVVGGGLTVIANAPNPAALGILNNTFEEEAYSSVKLFVYSIPFTLVAAVIFLLF